MESFVIMAQNNLKHELMAHMPAVTVSEQHQFRAMVTAAVQDAWRKELPGQRAPSSVVQSTIDDVQPSFIRKLTDERKPSRDGIINDALERFATFMRDHPDATKNQSIDARNQICRAAMERFICLVNADNEATSTSAQALATHGAESASTSAQAIKTASVAAASAVAASLGHQRASDSQYVQRAAAAAKAEIRKTAADAARQTVREIDSAVARIAKESAEEKSRRDAQAYAQRVANAQAKQAASTYARETATAQAAARAKQLASAKAGSSTSIGRFSSSSTLSAPTASNAPVDRSNTYNTALGNLPQLYVVTSPIGDASAASTSRSKSKSSSDKKASASNA
ncbi:hypothetical protein PAQ31011_04388 [Pandoraea aquatica]|uniref:Uncharacterized protein n=1 Tax=Pandoraea aquatica TaxID=2508290 RepID=A0A5E4Y993_9BURK|nr:hypothetical protein [Pandoraea aquatica]VVE45234.1 hypothetical protein PAQ31011_04388 [Pandoraea aquatica]